MLPSVPSEGSVDASEQRTKRRESKKKGGSITPTPTYHKLASPFKQIDEESAGLGESGTKKYEYDHLFIRDFQKAMDEDQLARSKDDEVKDADASP